MGLFDIFKETRNNDPYWAFDRSKHFRPRLNRNDFYRLEGFDFGWFLLEPISVYIGGPPGELIKGDQMSPGQKALYYWWYVDVQVRSGGFTQFYSKKFDKYVPTIIKSLEEIRDKKMAKLIRRTFDTFKVDSSSIEFDLLSKEYHEINGNTMDHIVSYVRKHPGEFCVDENGNEFDPNFSGQCEGFHPNGLVKEIVYYANGLPTGSREEFHEDGAKKLTVQKLFSEEDTRRYTWYFRNGNPKKQEQRQGRDNKLFGDYKEWFENGQLQIEGEYNNDQLRIRNGWISSGRQVIKDGNGYISRHNSDDEGNVTTHEQRYANYVAHGTGRTYLNGVLKAIDEMSHGKRHGVCRTLYNEDAVRSESTYIHGNLISKVDFPLYENPTVSTEITYEMQDEWLIKKDLPTADIYPVMLNKADVEDFINPPVKLFEGEQDKEFNVCYFVNVDKEGNVTAFAFLLSNNPALSFPVEAAISRLKFEPAIKDSKKTDSYVVVNFKFKLTGG
jgi:antitoxin component YwqK of YwqJK toxin-antitoxin module